MNIPVFLIAALACAGYLLGSIPFGLIISRMRGVDVREVGSGNIGATNVARNMGKGVGAVVLLLDAIKGFLPVAAPIYFSLGIATEARPLATAVTGAAAIAGHCFPVWLKFRGGKGVATALGVFCAVAPFAAAAAVLLWGICYALFRIASIGSMLVAIAFPVALYLLGEPIETVWLAVAAAALILFRHRGNLGRLLRREEYKV